MQALIDFVENYKKSNPNGWRKWLFGSIAVSIVIVLVLVYSVREGLRQREVARLRHERDMLQQQVHQNVVDAQLGDLNEAQQAHVAAAEEATQRAAALDKRAELLEAQHKANVALINSLKSWDDVDAHVN